MIAQKKQTKSTTVELVRELEGLSDRFKSPELSLIIEEAKAGEYHDYKNKKYPCGKTELHDKLNAIGLLRLAERVANGEFDEEPDIKDMNEINAMFSNSLEDIKKKGLGSDEF